jgi:hypothetical protein
VLKRSCASGWKTEKIVVSLADIIMSMKLIFSDLQFKIMIPVSCTFQYNAHNPPLLFGCGTIVDSLQYLGLNISVSIY